MPVSAEHISKLSSASKSVSGIEKKRLLWLDIAKGFAITCVVLGHCLSDTLMLHDLIYSFHMPLFFMLSGFTMRAKERKQLLITSLRRLMIPYFIVSAILLFFAFVPPSSVSSALDTQRSPAVVLVEIFYGAGSEGVIVGHTFQAIGAIWFLPCLFFGRVMLNEVLLHTQGAQISERVLQPVCVLIILWLGFFIGNSWHLPMDIDTAMIAVFFMYLGYLLKRVGTDKVPWYLWLVFLGIWLFYTQAGDNEMAVRAYLEHPYSLITAAAGSFVIIRLCMFLEHVVCLRHVLAWAGMSSLLILCVHRLESAIFNWQKIMESFAPDVWNWDQLLQGLYQFCLRFTLIVLLTFTAQLIWHAISRARQSKKAAKKTV